MSHLRAGCITTTTATTTTTTATTTTTKTFSRLWLWQLHSTTALGCGRRWRWNRTPPCGDTEHWHQSQGGERKRQARRQKTTPPTAALFELSYEDELGVAARRCASPAFCSCAAAGSTGGGSAVGIPVQAGDRSGNPRSSGRGAAFLAVAHLDWLETLAKQSSQAPWHAMVQPLCSQDTWSHGPSGSRSAVTKMRQSALALQAICDLVKSGHPCSRTQRSW